MNVSIQPEAETYFIVYAEAREKSDGIQCLRLIYNADLERE